MVLKRNHEVLCVSCDYLDAMGLSEIRQSKLAMEKFYRDHTGLAPARLFIEYDLVTNTYTIKPDGIPHIDDVTFKEETTMTGWKMFDEVKDICSRMFLSGPHGIGKTYAVRQMKNGNGLAQLTLTEDHTVQELMGHFLPTADGFVWHNGTAVSVFISGGMLLINEMDKATGAVLDFMLGICDDPEVAELTLPSGKSYRPGAGLQIIATSNRTIDSLPVALADRFEVNLNITEPHPELVEVLNQKRPKLGDYIRDSYKDPERFISPRKALAFTKFLQTKGEDVAGQMAFGDRWFDIDTAMKLQTPVGIEGEDE